jgi:uncharacterized protein
MPPVPASSSPEAKEGLGSFPPLGVGFPYIAELPAELYRPDLLDFVEVTPETLCRVRRDGALRSLIIVPDKFDRARAVVGGLPIVVHGVELSIGSAIGCNEHYLDLLDRFQRLWPFCWHSEHLSYQTIPGDGGALVDIGIPLPLPGTDEVVRLVGNRAAAIGSRYGVPFLLENPAHYLRALPYDPEVVDEIGLMTAVTKHGHCHQLLDLHNLYCNAINHGFNPFTAVDRISLDRVGEIHVAGGRWQSGYWNDTHDGRVPSAVWDLLDYTLQRCAHVGGVVFELMNYYAAKMTPEAIAEEVTKARRIWQRHQPVTGIIGA